jgi:hypothetical protein
MHSERCTSGSARGHAKLPVVRSVRRACSTQPFVCMATINATLYAVFASSARRLLASPRAQRRFNLAGGSLLSVAGVWALLAKRPA